ncbi:hypothetical protein OCF65_18705 [Bacillus toyonensis]|uniref:hypothetical protein n=1 Tax=Bacillus cereus group TaxID=86661 RepID=UPI0010BDE122|nr:MULTISPECIES: hypothetical protein [Bacillus cereus group]MCU5582469.1 hypothetical protein [Bacillus toyonensis]TKH76849.1 hypothetical protein FC688_21990 [Bacillus cereus]
MADKKEEIKKEINRNLRSIAILIIVIGLIYFDISIAKYLNFTQDPKIIWALDFGIYNSLISMIFSVVYYILKDKKLQVEINILNKKEDTNEITLRENPEEIYVKLHVEGKYKKVSSKIEIVFPDWLEVQVRPNSYVSFNDEKNMCLIDLESLISQKENICLTKSVTLDIINNEPEKNTDLIEPKLAISFWAKFFKIDLQKKGIKIQSK